MLFPEQKLPIQVAHINGVKVNLKWNKMINTPDIHVTKTGNVANLQFNMLFVLKTEYCCLECFAYRKTIL